MIFYLIKYVRNQFFWGTDMENTENTVQKKGRGGARKGAGRKPLPGAYMTTIILTEALRPKIKRLGGSKWIRHQIEIAEEPQTLNAQVKEIPPEAMLVSQPPTNVSLPLADFGAQTGTPSPAESYLNGSIDLNSFVISDASNTFFVKVSGDSMDRAGVEQGDLLVVERQRKAQHGDIVVMRINNEFTVKRLYQKDNVVKLVPESSNPVFKEIVPNQVDSWYLVGVVTFVIKKL